MLLVVVVVVDRVEWCRGGVSESGGRGSPGGSRGERREGLRMVGWDWIAFWFGIWGRGWIWKEGGIDRKNERKKEREVC